GICRAVAESGAGDGSATPFVAPRTVAVSRPAGKRWQTLRVHNKVSVWISFSWKPVRIAESSGLYLFNRSFYGGGRGIAGSHGAHFYVFLGAFGLIRLCGVHLGCFKNRLQFRSSRFHRLYFWLYGLWRHENVRLRWRKLGLSDRFRRWRVYFDNFGRRRWRCSWNRRRSEERRVGEGCRCRW